MEMTSPPTARLHGPAVELLAVGRGGGRAGRPPRRALRRERRARPHCRVTRPLRLFMPDLFLSGTVRKTMRPGPRPARDRQQLVLRGLERAQPQRPAPPALRCASPRDGEVISMPPYI
jgi:hypothetical protein